MYAAKDYVDFKSFKIKWNKLLTDITNYCNIKYSIFKAIKFNKYESTLSREIIFITDKGNFRFYIGLDINGDVVNFTFCKFKDFEHYVTIDNLENLISIIWDNIIYS